ncbi:MAG: magnesium transporter [Sedimenticola sp.]|mgnify:CR=1 FL=1|uniref:Magnesium transporter MgtE n=1 Tax=Sedimenticola thiotaurini TaxID=1543721 RepID=A0A558DC63_9GAMM|nr:magnesium transporter [Sedimenticola sp.]TVT58617.1 MAG: magnesium transporter [Sedimenticola thiotaurini]MCW8882579.1 magnesium transporter [Sedimenticola sp.]MCW8946990.1 magnesium transporter [Sedimenticola sp.]MCW8974895.1 magnesium transporter [Sedimenticola sp.]
MSNQASLQFGNTRLDRLHLALESGALLQAGKMLNALHPGEIAHLLESLPMAQREIIWELVNEDNGGEVLTLLADEVRDDLISKMDMTELLAATEGLDTDDLADLIQELPRTITQEILDSLDQQHRERLEAILSYPEDTAGGLMNPDTITVRPEVTLDVVMRYLRHLKDKIPPQTDNLMVVNRNGKYLGVLPLTVLVTHDLDDTVAEVMSLDARAIPANWDDGRVANRFEQHDLISAAVVDDEGKLIGRITIDDVVDVIREEGEHQFMGQAGLSEDEDMFAPVLVSTRRRALWLGINLVTALLASWVIGQFEATIEKVVALAVLMPIVASMGGIAGSQTLTLTIRGIALGQLSRKNTRWLILKELAVGSLNSVIWACVVAVIAGFWFNDINIGLLIATAMCINLILASLTGTVLPMALDKLGIDPALAGSVLLTTVTDIVGFLSFLGLATLFLI